MYKILTSAIVLLLATGCVTDPDDSGPAEPGPSGAAVFGTATGHWEATLTHSEFSMAQIEFGTAAMPRLIIASVEGTFQNCTGTRHVVIELSENGQSGLGSLYLGIDCEEDGFAVTGHELNFDLQKGADNGSGLGMFSGTWEAMGRNGDRCQLTVQDGAFETTCDGNTWSGMYSDGMFTGQNDSGIELAAQRVGAPIEGPRLSASDYGPLIGGWALQIHRGAFGQVLPTLNLRMDGGQLVAEARWNRGQECQNDVFTAIEKGVNLTIDGDSVTGRYWKRTPTCDGDFVREEGFDITATRDGGLDSNYGAIGGVWALDVDGQRCALRISGDGFVADCGGDIYSGHGRDAIVSVKDDGYFEMAAHRIGN